MRRSRGRAPALAVAAALALAGCTGGLGQQARSEAGSGANYVSGDGTVTRVAPGDRGAPVRLSGRTADGSTVDVADWRGGVVVVNVWYAGCAPCRAEAPDLAELARAAAADGVRFVGLNTRDDAGTAAAFDRRYGMPYPSVLDASSGAALLSLRGTVPPQAVPSTVVLDAQGRPAGRILGRLDPGVLRQLVEDVAATTGSTAPSAAAAAG